MSSDHNATTDTSAGTRTARATTATAAAAVNVTIEVGAAIVCTPQGGNAHVYRSKPVNAIHWHSDVPFTLKFYTFDEAATEGWPFAPPEPRWPVLDCLGVPQGSAAPLYFKYTISAGVMFLDPIVIIDK